MLIDFYVIKWYCVPSYIYESLPRAVGCLDSLFFLSKYNRHFIIYTTDALICIYTVTFFIYQIIIFIFLFFKLFNEISFDNNSSKNLESLYKFVFIPLIEN